MAAFVDLGALEEIVRANAGPFVAISWGNTPNPMAVSSGLDPDGGMIAGLPTNPRARPVHGSGSSVSITLDIPSIQAVGVDDTRREFVTSIADPSGSIAMAQFGIRHFSLTMRVEADAYPAALTVCERMRTRWLRKSTRAALHAIDCAIREVGDTRSGNVQIRDQKTMDVATLEVMLAFRAYEADPIGETTPVGNWIASTSPTPITFTRG